MMECDMSASTEYDFPVTQGRTDQLPWYIGARLILIFSILGWLIVLLPILLIARVI
jgi:hypothetical protein